MCHFKVKLHVISGLLDLLEFNDTNMTASFFSAGQNMMFLLYAKTQSVPLSAV